MTQSSTAAVMFKPAVEALASQTFGQKVVDIIKKQCEDDGGLRGDGVKAITASCRVLAPTPWT